MKRILAAILCLFALGGSIYAGAEDDARAYYVKVYRQIERDLQFGDPTQRIEAAQLMGSFRDDRFARLLGHELKEGLEEPLLNHKGDTDPVARPAPIYEPFVKYQIAWALGKIASMESLDDLIASLQLVSNIVDASIKYTQSIRQNEETRNSPRIVLDQDRPGPAMLHDGWPFSSSPDVYWSIADDFKSMAAINDRDEGIRIRLEGYNYVNLLMGVMIAIGETGARYSGSDVPKQERPQEILTKALNALKPFLNHSIPSVRASAVRAIAGIKTLASAAALEEHFAKEQDDRVKVRICLSILTIDKARSNYYAQLVSFLHSPRRDVRTETARALRDLALGESVNDLEAALKVEEYPEIRRILEAAIQKAENDIAMPVSN